MRNYTDTETFRQKVEHLRAASISDENIERYTAIYRQFDENGMEVGTDYSKVVLAFPHPIP